MKSILLHAEDDAGFEARLQVALELARTHDSHLTCLQVVNHELFVTGDFYGSAMAVAVSQMKETAEEFRAKVEADLDNEDVKWEWQQVSGYPTSRLLEKSALNDIIVIGPRDVGQIVSAPSSMVAELALKSSVPVLVVPNEMPRFDARAPVLVAWNKSSEACAALRAATPLLRKASKVVLASVAEDSKTARYDVPPVEGAEYLSRYGIHTELLEIERGDANVADVIFSEAKSLDCGLVVMGAYGHSRLAEFLLGGVTRRALAEPELPILLAH